MIFAVYVKPDASVEHITTNLPKTPFVYRGPDAAKKFMEYLTSLAEEVDRIYKREEPMCLTAEQEESFQSSTVCYLCLEKFTEDNYKVRDHSHITGEYRGSAHNNCNLRCRRVNYIPVFLHNLS